MYEFLYFWCGESLISARLHRGTRNTSKMTYKKTQIRNLTAPEQHEVLWPWLPPDRAQRWFLRRFIWSDGSALKARLCGTRIETSLMAKGQQIFDEKSDGKNVTCFTIWLDPFAHLPCEQGGQVNLFAPSYMYHEPPDCKLTRYWTELSKASKWQMQASRLKRKYRHVNVLAWCW